MLITEDFIKNFLDNCNITDFTMNDKGIIENEQLTDYIGSLVENIIKAAEENAYNEIINNKIKSEVDTALTDYKAKVLNIFDLMTMEIHNYLVSKYADENDIAKKVLLNINHFSLKLFTIIFSVYLSNCVTGIMSQIRILYENYIILRFIGKHPIMCEDYFDHAVYRRYALMKSYWKELTPEEESEMIKIAQNHNEDFFADYGWTYKVISDPKQRKIITMIENLDMNDYVSINYRELYKVANNFIHPSTFAVLHDKIVYGKLTNDYLKMAVELITNSIIYLMKHINCDNKERIIIMNVLYGLREDLFNEPKIYPLTGEIVT
jgi:hypothetical protein